MKKFTSRIVVLWIMFVCAHTSWGGQINAYVSGFAVTGAQNRDEMKGALQTLMMSRLNSDSITVVDTPGGADVTVSGSYLVIGRIFSLDAVAKNSSGNVIARAFVQGEGQDELIPAVGKLAKSLSDTIVKVVVATSSPAPVASPAPPQPVPVAVPQQVIPPAVTAEKKAEPDVVRKEAVPPPASDIVRPAAVQKGAAANWVSQRIDGAMSGVALGRILADGEREIFVVGEHVLRYYRQAQELKLVAEVPFAVGEKVLSVDTADLDGDGVPEVYLTVMVDDYLASQVWLPGEGSLKKIADKLPYFFRGIALGGKEKKLYAQEKGMDGDFYGDVQELVLSGGKYVMKNPIKLPRYGYIYNFDTFTDAQGKNCIVLLNRDGYLAVYSQELEELWKSSDKFGGSELSFRRPYKTSVSGADNFTNVVFIDQRITVTKEGEVVVPQNGGFWVVGNSRSYSKNSIYAFKWNGSTMVEQWHTAQSQNYLPDYAYDEAKKELVLLEVVKREGLLGKGASALAIKKVD